MPDMVAKTGDVSNPRNQELLWEARQHPNDLIIPEAHPTQYPGKWVAIFDGSLPMDQLNGLRVEGFHLYRHVVSLPNDKLQVIICEDKRPDHGDEVTHEPTQERYKQYTHPKAAND